MTVDRFQHALSSCHNRHLLYLGCYNGSAVKGDRGTVHVCAGSTAEVEACASNIFRGADAPERDPAFDGVLELF